MTFDLNLLENKLRTSEKNTFEYYQNGKKHQQEFNTLYEDVKRVSYYLEQLNLKEQSRVIILGKNSYEWVVIDLACVIKGIVTIPLEVGKTYEISELFETFEADLLCTNLQDISTLEHPKIQSFEEILSVALTLDIQDYNLQPYHYQPDDIFTLIFTSGTLGKSKFIEVRKKSFDHLIQESQALYQFNKQDRFLVFLPLPIYLERCYIYASLLVGFSVILAPLELVFHAIQTDKPSIIIGVPYFFETFRTKFTEKIKSKLVYRLVFQSYLSLRFMGLGFLVKNKFAPFVKAWGGNIRYLLTGSAPITLQTLLFYKKMGITLYEGYGMSEIGGMISLNSPGHVKLGSVGKPFPGKEVIISPEGEILVKGNLMANDTYYKLPPEESSKTYIETGLVATGDIGYIDSEGFLFINGRIKDIVVLSSGKKIHPGAIEEVLISTGLFTNALVFGENKPNLVAVLVPKTPEISKEQISTELKRVNERLTAEEKILNFYLHNEAFTVQNNMLTTSLKLNRKNVVSQLKKQIEELY